MTEDESAERERLRAKRRPHGLPFRIGKIGHVALHVADIPRSIAFYVDVLGFEVSDVYPPEMAPPAGMAFLRCNPDHHGIALVGGPVEASANAELHHLAFEVGSLDEVLAARAHLKAAGAVIDFDGRRRAGWQFAVEFRDPDGHRLEIYWGIDQIGTDGRARPASQWKGAPTLELAIADPVEGQDASLRDDRLSRR
ncbi:MAG: VOC family protein [Alphaproteobacteria bacterium]